MKGAGAAVTAPRRCAYADAWLAERTLSPTTRDHYRRLMETTNRRTGRKVGPTARAHAYGLLRTIMITAISVELIPANSCRVHRGGSARTAKRMRARRRWPNST